MSLPSGWIATTVSDLYEVIGGGTPTTANEDYWKGNIPWISSADIHGLHDIRPRKCITQEAIEQSATNLVPASSIIVVTRVGLGKVALAPYSLCFSQDSQALISRANNVLPEYALYYLSTAVQEFKHTGRGTTISGVTKQQLKDLKFVLPPLDQQKLIVEKIEELFSQLDSGVSALKRVQANLKRYKASVLKAACEGRLVPTEAELARRKGRPYESGADLLRRILHERREKWAAEQRSRGKDPAKLKYEEPRGPESGNLPELPEGWCWARFGQLFNVFVGSTPSRAKSDFWGGTIPWVSSGEVAFCRIKATKETISETGLQNSSCQIHPIGTVLLGMIGEGKTRGQAAILDIPAAHNQNIASIRVSEIDFPPEYIYYYLLGNYEKTRNIGSGNNQPALNKARVQDIVFPLPPLAEQKRIIEELDRLIYDCDILHEVSRKQLTRAEKLRQSILKRAFEGRLVGETEETSAV